MELPPSTSGVPRRQPAARLLVALVVMFLCTPFLDNLPQSELIENVLLSIVMIAAVRAVGAAHHAQWVALAMVVPALGFKWWGHFLPNPTVSALHLLTGLLYLSYVVWHLVIYVLRAPRVDGNVLCAGLAGYLLLGLLWLPAYLVAASLDPHAFSLPGGSPLKGFDAFYFSFVTLCTVGYGDVTPVSKPARMLAIMEAIAGLFYVAVLISRLVAIYTSSPPNPPDAKPDREVP